MKVDKLNRRIFLQGLGGLLVTIPTLPSLMEKAVASIPTGRNKRFLSVLSCNQLNPHLMFNSGAVLSSYQNGYRYADLTTANLPGLAPILGEPFSAFAPKLSLLRGLNLGNIGHNWTGRLGNVAGSASYWETLTPEPTIDVKMAQHSGISLSNIYRMGNGSKTHSTDGLQDNQWGNGTLGHLSNSNPYLVFERYFTSQQNPGNTMAAKKTLVDRIKGDLTASLLNRGFISAADKRFLQDHMDFLNDLEKRYGGEGTQISCNPGSNVYTNTPRSGAPTNIAEYRQYLKDCAILLAEGVKCNIFPLGHIGVHSSVSNGIILNQNGGDDNWHLLVAHGEKHRDLRNANQWILQEVFLELISRLDVLESGSDTYLDNSIVAFIPELSEWHHQKNMGVVLAGKGGGTLNAGKLYDFGNPAFSYVGDREEDGTPMPHHASMPFKRLWNGLLQAWGMTPAQYEKPGRAGYGEHAYLADLSYPQHGSHPYDTMARYVINNSATYFQDIGKPLPGLFRV